MFGRKKKRSLLKNQLLEEAKKDRYKLQLKGHITSLSSQYDHFYALANLAKEKNDKQAIDLNIRQASEIKNHLDKLQELLSYILKMETDTDMKDVYDEFLEQLQTYTEDFKENKQRKRKTKKVIKKHHKEVKYVSNHFALIDKRIESINKTINKNISETKPLTDKQVAQFFDKNE